MASKTVVELFDDLDGGRADETVSFALDGVEYEIDLSSANAAALRDVLAEFIAHGHRVTGRSRNVTRTITTSGITTGGSTAGSSTAGSGTAGSGTTTGRITTGGTTTGTTGTIGTTTAASAKPEKAKGKGKSSANSNASMTAEIRRLASESAKKANEARNLAAEVEEEDVEPDLFNTAPEVLTERPTQSEQVGPVPALIIPFQEAGL